MPAAFAASPEFRKLLAGQATVDLATIALEIAADAEPHLDRARYEAQLDALVARVRDRCAAADAPRRVLAQIQWVLFVEEGFAGNTDDYYDPRNSSLSQVIDRKLGIPITLSIIYLRIAQRLGLRVAGVNMPGHFLLRVEDAAGPIFVDAFHGGTRLDADGCRSLLARLGIPTGSLRDDSLKPCPASMVVTRLLSNLRSIHQKAGDYLALLPVQTRLAALWPDDPTEQRDLGLLCLRVERPGDAIAPLQNYLNAQPAAHDAAAIEALLRAALRDLALRN